MLQVCGFLRGLRFPPPIKTDCHDITEILLKVASNTITNASPPKPRNEKFCNTLVLILKSPSHQRPPSFIGPDFRYNEIVKYYYIVLVLIRSLILCRGGGFIRGGTTEILCNK